MAYFSVGNNYPAISSQPAADLEKTEQFIGILSNDVIKRKWRLDDYNFFLSSEKDRKFVILFTEILIIHSLTPFQLRCDC